MESERHILEDKQFAWASSTESRTLAKAQLLRDLASSSGENQAMRDELIQEATKLFTDKDVKKLH